VAGAVNARCAHPKRDEKPQQELGVAFAYSSGTTDGICLDAFRVRGYARQVAWAERVRSVGDPHPFRERKTVRIRTANFGADAGSASSFAAAAPQSFQKTLPPLWTRHLGCTLRPMVCATTPGTIARGLATSLAVLWLSCATGCGAKAAANTETGGPPDRATADNQARVPAEIQHAGELRYFFAAKSVDGPKMVVFEDPHTPRIVSLTHPEGRYRAGISSWSGSGRTLAYQLFSEETGIQTYRFTLADIAQGFEPRPVDHEGLRERAYFISWVADRAIAVQTGVYHNEFDYYGWTGHYLWIDRERGTVTDLGSLAGSSADSQKFGVLSALDASDEHLWTSSFGLAFLDERCNLVYLETPEKSQKLLTDCSAVGAFSKDGSFLAVNTASAHLLYHRVDGRLERWEFPGLESSLPKAQWRWAPNSSKFILYSADADQSWPPPLTGLAFGDASTRAFAPVAELNGLNYANFVTDDLVIASSPESTTQVGSTYLLDLRQVQDNELEFVPIAAQGSPAASSDSRRLYFPEHPLREITIEAAHAAQTSTLFSEATPVQSILFRLLNDDQVGLISSIEPEQVPAGSGPESGFERVRQYVLNLRDPRAIVPMGTFDFTHHSGSTGMHSFVSAPDLGGIFYLGDDERGGYVDWRGFDDIAHSVRLLQAPGCCFIAPPPKLAPPDSSQ